MIVSVCEGSGEYLIVCVRERKGEEVREGGRQREAKSEGDSETEVNR